MTLVSFKLTFYHILTIAIFKNRLIASVPTVLVSFLNHKLIVIIILSFLNNVYYFLSLL